MFKSIAANPLRKTILALGALAAVVTAAPSFAGGYVEGDVIYADEIGTDGQVGTDGRRSDHRRPIVRPAPVIEDYDLIPARHITRQLRRQGYASVQEIALRGDEYRVVAVRNNGALVRLRLDAYSGEVLSVRRIGWVGAPVRPLPRRHAEPGFAIEFGWGSDRY